MKHVARLGNLACFGLVLAVVACSGSAAVDGPGGSLGGSGNDAGAPSTGGSAGVDGGAGGTRSGVGGSGVGGTRSGVGGSGAGGDSGSAGAGGTGKACGGFIGSTCSATEYCAYMPGQACGAADASSTCQPRPGLCDAVYMPVCGCDQKTYSNTCDAAMHGQGVGAQGMCPAQM